MRLLNDIATVDGRRVRTYAWQGRDIRVRDDADTALRIIELFGDKTGTPQMKLASLVDLLFVDVKELEGVEDLPGLLAEAAWNEAKLDITGAHRNEIGNRRVLDWDEDADVIQTSLLQCYGVSWDEARYRFSYDQLTAMLGMIEHETPLGQALYYRTAKAPKRTNYNADEIKAFNERKRFWALKGKGKEPEDRYKAMSDATDRAFEAMLKRG